MRRFIFCVALWGCNSGNVGEIDGACNPDGTCKGSMVCRYWGGFVHTFTCQPDPFAHQSGPGR